MANITFENPNMEANLNTTRYLGKNDFGNDCYEVSNKKNKKWTVELSSITELMEFYRIE